MAEVALAYAARGWRVFPLFPIVDGRCGCGRACGTKPGKHPALKGWTTRATTDEATIRGWWEKWPNAGIGIATGRGSGLVVVDRDGAAGGTLRGEFESEHGALPDTAVAETGREGGGDHSYYRYPKDGPPLKGIRTGKLDILADGNYVVAPPSIHASGKEYAWKPGSTVLAEIAPEIAATLRAWIEAKSKGERAEAKSNATAAIKIPEYLKKLIPAGQRLNNAARIVEPPPAYSLELVAELREVLSYHDADCPYEKWRNVGMSLHHGSQAAEWGRELFFAWSRTAKGVYREDAWNSIWNSFGHYDGPQRTLASLYDVAIEKGWERREIIQYPPVEPDPVEGDQSDAASPDDPSSTPREIDHTDIGNGRRLVKQFGDRLRYVHALKRWLIWDGTHWRIDDDLGVVRFAKETVNEMHRQASQMEFSKARDDFHKWAFASSTRERISAMIEMAKSEVEVILAPDKLDADPWLLGVQNGVIELSSGTFRPARQEDYITKRASVAYDREAKCPNFLAFIHKVTGGHKELVGYLQRVFGYVLTGSVAEEKIFVLYGGGSNGKTTYREVLRGLLGDYAISADAGLLTSKKEPGGATPEIARLQGRRFVSVNETAKDDELNEPASNSSRRTRE